MRPQHSNAYGVLDIVGTVFKTDHEKMLTEWLSLSKSNTYGSAQHVERTMPMEWHTMRRTGEKNVWNGVKNVTNFAHCKNQFPIVGTLTLNPP